MDGTELDILLPARNLGRDIHGMILHLGGPEESFRAGWLVRFIEKETNGSDDHESNGPTHKFAATFFSGGEFSLNNRLDNDTQCRDVGMHTH